MEIPQKYDPEEAEARWRARWEEWDLFRWDPNASREDSFVVDTPPPTVSGELHIGHVFSYTPQDLLVRYQRMRGKNIAYPMGFDDNGLPTERRVQNVFGIRPNRSLPYDPNWKPRRDRGKKDPIEEVSRANFVEACGIVCEEDEAAFAALWRSLGLSVDWELTYRTIDPHCRRVAQISFLDLVEKGQVYSALSPTMWDPDDRTAIAQAEVEDRDRPGALHSVRFGVEGGGELVISTTRPELLGACIAVVAHPDDERYQALFGKRAITPLFHAPVPILAARHADPEKGTGILMVCTFGDAMDVEWWKASGLPLKQMIDIGGRMLAVDYGEPPYESLDPARAQRTQAEIQGKTVAQAQRRMAELLAEAGSAVDGEGAALVGEPEPIQHPVKFYERGRRPLEFLPARQWFVRLLEHKDALIAQGRKIQWHPEFMRARYENWVEGLNQDWCISRQRYAGVPFPVWYPLDSEGNPDYDAPIFARPEDLPVDPLSDAAPGYQDAQRDAPGGFSADPDVMDTWATSSLSPEIISGWPDDRERHAKLFPTDIRPQAHEIIRTWAFYTIAKAWLHEDEIPWHHAVISGWVLDPNRKKMSKSKGNVLTPAALLSEHSADAIRYWAGRARLGVDTAMDPKVFKLGRRLVTKLFNASRFALGQLERAGAEFSAVSIDDIREPLDLAYAARLRDLVEQATRSFDAFEYAGALQITEERFWEFCDDYLELVKVRSYADDDTPARRSAIAVLQLSLRTFLRLFAPFMPFVTEEIWSWRFAADGSSRSIHTSAWPGAEETSAIPAPAHADAFECAVEVLRKIRSTKTQAKKSLRWPIAQLEVRGPESERASLAPVISDVLLAGNADKTAYTLADGPSPDGTDRFAVTATLGEEGSP
jgi:valyl-tRNA synthetase